MIDEDNSDKVEPKFSSYVHISNSGYNFEVEVKGLDSKYKSQYLTIELKSFGLPLLTTVWLDENTIEALEYILNKAKQQREFYKINSVHGMTAKATPPHNRNTIFSTDDCDNES